VVAPTPKRVGERPTELQRCGVVAERLLNKARPNLESEMLEFKESASKTLIYVMSDEKCLGESAKNLETT